MTNSLSSMTGFDYILILLLGGLLPLILMQIVLTATQSYFTKSMTVCMTLVVLTLMATIIIALRVFD